MQYIKGLFSSGIELLLCCLFFLFCSVPDSWATPPISVTFIAPAPLSSVPFWDDYVDFMGAAASDLGIDLSVLGAESRFEEAENVAKALLVQPKPDYLVHIYQAGSSISQLEMADKAGVKTVIVNTSVVDQDREVVRLPRDKFPLWIGHIYPDDTEAGYQLMDLLIEKAKTMKLYADDNKIHAVGIGGNLFATSSLHREEGMRKSIKDHPDVLLERYVLAQWDSNLACGKTMKLLELYPKTKIVWAVNDHTAMGALHAMAAKGIKAGEDVLTGGIDWSPESIKAIKDGRMVASIGGHFMEGAWALIMILDYHNGHDFAAPNPTLRSHMTVINEKNINVYSVVLDRTDWGRIDFKRLSKTYNPNLKEYKFSPEEILDQLR